MSGTVTPTDEFATDSRSFVIGVPAETTTGVLGEYGTYLRLGSVNADEALLQQDPSVSASTATLIGTGYTTAFSAGKLSYSTGTTQIVAPKGYMRFGAPTPYETWLASDPNAGPAKVAPPAAAPATLPFNYSGILLQSTDTIGMVAPTISQTAARINTTVNSVTNWTGSSLNATFTGGNLASVTVVEADAIPVLSTATLQMADNFSTLVGSNITSVLGNNATVWAGNDASTGVGSLLWSNFGTTQNVFGGQVVNITNGSLDVNGLGEAKVSDFTVMAPSSICFGVAPTAPLTTLAAAVIGNLKLVNTVAAAFMGAAVAASALTVWVGSDVAEGVDSREDANKNIGIIMTAYKDAMRVMDGIVGAIQIAAVFAGMATTKAAEAAVADPITSSKISLTNGTIVLEAGGTKVSIGAGGFRVDAGDPVAMPEAIAAYALVLAAQPLSTAESLGIYNMALANPGGLSQNQALMGLQNGLLGVPAVAPPAITLNSMLVKTAALQIQNDIYTP